MWSVRANCLTGWVSDRDVGVRPNSIHGCGLIDLVCRLRPSVVARGQILSVSGFAALLCASRPVVFLKPPCRRGM